MNGPKTEDSDLKKRIEQTAIVDKNLKKLKNIILNFTKSFESKFFLKSELMHFNRDISEIIFTLYDQSDEYKDFADIITRVHVEGNKLFNQISSDINTLNKKTEDWDSYFNPIKHLLIEREKHRKVYDHYETKLEKLVQTKEEKTEKGTLTDTSNFCKKMKRVNFCLKN